MKKLILCCAVLLAVLACSLDFSQNTEQNQNNQPTGPTGVTPTASPLPGVPVGAVATVRVSEIGRELCGTATDPDVLPPFPCKAVVTCTPLDSGGKDVGLGYTPDWNVVGPGGVTPTSVNPYNARAECDGTTGSILVVCTVSGKAGVKGYTCRG